MSFLAALASKSDDFLRAIRGTADDIPPPRAPRAPASSGRVVAIGGGAALGLTGAGIGYNLATGGPIIPPLVDTDGDGTPDRRAGDDTPQLIQTAGTTAIWVAIIAAAAYVATRKEK